MVNYLEKRIREAWRRGFLDCCESVDMSGFGATLPWCEKIKMSLNIDPRGDLIGLSDEGLAAILQMLNLLPPRMSELFYGMGAIRIPDADALSQTKGCLMVKSGNYAE